MKSLPFFLSRTLKFAFKLFKIIHLQEMGQNFLEGNKLLLMVNKMPKLIPPPPPPPPLPFSGGIPEDELF